MSRQRVNFRSLPLRHQEEFLGVDMNTRTIHGAAIIQAGSLNDDRPWHIDQHTLEQVVELGNRRNRGLKARLTHPNMSDDGMGKVLGKWSNFRIDGDTVRADLKIAESADKSFVGEIGTYVLELAAEDPDLFGVSIVSELSEEMFEEDTDLFDEELGTTAFRLSTLYAADVVDEPAATRGGLFDTNGLADLPAMVTRVIDTHFAEATPEELLSRFEGFTQKYFKDSSIQFQIKKEEEMAEEVKLEQAEMPEAKDLETTVEDIQLSQEEVDATTTITEEVVAEEVAPLSQEFGNQMLEKYGSEGLQLAWEGKSEVDIINHFRQRDLEEIETLKKQLAAQQEFQGEAEALSASQEQPKVSEEKKLAEELRKQHAVYPEMAAIITKKNSK